MENSDPANYCFVEGALRIASKNSLPLQMGPTMDSRIIWGNPEDTRSGPNGKPRPKFNISRRELIAGLETFRPDCIFLIDKTPVRTVEALASAAASAAGVDPVGDPYNSERTRRVLGLWNEAYDKCMFLILNKVAILDRLRNLKLLCNILIGRRDPAILEDIPPTKELRLETTYAAYWRNLILNFRVELYLDFVRPEANIYLPGKLKGPEDPGDITNIACVEYAIAFFYLDICNIYKKEIFKSDFANVARKAGITKGGKRKSRKSKKSKKTLRKKRRASHRL